MILPFDEVDALIASVRQRAAAISEQMTDEGGMIPGEKRKPALNADELIDEVADLLVLDFVYGTAAAAEMLGVEIAPDMDDMRKSIEKRIDDKDFRDRIREYAPQGDAEAIVRVIDTDSTRVFNEGIVSAARKVGATTKTWQTMMDDRVRDAHMVLQDVTIPLDADFYTDGDHAPAPGQFNEAYLNCGCRCWLTVK